ncbi:hypothetical protein BCR33DRAFT_713035 [Rhizoclosmatium globosum]|uniref:Uncharacterized protein n=1 Tax=Rhizoclosmatium globosum TaxID=329046 RepID=A0A1Y2CVR7_9FUNG|nr:hypothetical protein BCR33DRAFT_713035 [Rhizoclosmatium globosum]|eukprot:ORY51122.1 hypothetical protein BCR33DRAFT_713035 [Rhizoclosmatium globosum]
MALVNPVSIPFTFLHLGMLLIPLRSSPVALLCSLFVTVCFVSVVDALSPNVYA